MNRLQKIFLILYVLLNINSTVFGMDDRDNQKAVTLPVYCRAHPNSNDFFPRTSSGSLSEEAKIFTNKDKHGSCSIGYSEGKWFLQPINSSNGAIIEPKIEIIKPDDDLQVALSNDHNFQKLVIEANGKNYLFINNAILSLQPCVPYKKIDQKALLYSEEYKLIFANGKTAQDKATIFNTSTVNNEKYGVIGSHRDKTIFIDIYENQKHTETISLNVPDYENIAQVMLTIKSHIILSYNEENGSKEKNILKIQKRLKSQADSEQEKTLQISHKIYVSQYGCPTSSHTLYPATATTTSSSNNEYEIKFNIAGIEFIRLVQLPTSSGHDLGKYYVDISDIIPKAYAYFFKPDTYTCCYLESGRQIAMNPLTKENSSTDSTEDSVATKQLAEISRLSQTLIAYNHYSQAFLPSYNGIISEVFTPASTRRKMYIYSLQIDGIVDKPIYFITLSDRSDEILSGKKLSLILQDPRNGKDLCHVMCNTQQTTPSIKNDIPGHVINTRTNHSTTETIGSDNSSWGKLFWNHKFKLIVIGIIGTAGIFAWFSKNSNRDNITQ